MERLRLLRQEKTLTQAEMAERIGVARTTYSKWETGEREPDFKTISELASYFNVTTDYILGRTDDPTQPSAKKEGPINDRDLKIAFWGNPDEDDDLLDDVRSYALFIKERKKAHGTKDEKPD